MGNIIEIEDLSKRFQETLAVDHISFSVRKGDLFAFLGTNGAGKSTTINMICTLLSKTSGRVVVDGLDIDKSAADARKRIGVVFQGNVLDDLLTVEDNLSLRARFAGLKGSSQISELSRLLDLKEIWKRPYGKLSGGQKRKCEIARALLGKPALLILDEPTTGLDPQTRKSIWTLVRELQKKQGVTVFLTTHYMEEAATSDDVVILEKGRICARGTPDSLKTMYGKDTLRLRFENMSAGQEALKKLGYAPERQADCLKLSVADSHEAMSILNQIGGFLDFELVKGNMDDVFLAVTGHAEVPQ
ncbi:MAG: ABC transporter ATP-binding protein [Clostridiales bacterium]|nr:ABC transporter ATP-binding protein [Clostridiales bacterium]